MILGIVTGLAAEARLARGFATEVGGGTHGGADAAARRLVARGATALLSLGFAGGLDPALEAGALAVPEIVQRGFARWSTDAALVAVLGGATIGTLLVPDTILATPAEKHAARAATGADAVDLESAAVAGVAVAAGLPFAALRAISDPAGLALPPAALIPLRAGGRIDLPRLAGSLIAHPAQLPALIPLARHAAAARSTLVGALQALDPTAHPRP